MKMLFETRNGQVPLEAEASYRMVAETAADGIVTFDAEGVILYVNPAVEPILGHRADDLPGQKLSLLMPDYLDRLYLKSLDRYLTTGEKSIACKAVEIHGRHKDGRDIPLEVSFGECSTEADRLFICVLRDVTERYHAEALVRKANQTLRAIIQASPLGIVGCDADRNVTIWNSAAERIFGWSEREVLGRPLPRVYEGGREEARSLNDLLQSGATYTTEGVRYRKDGTQIHVSISAAPLRNEDGSIAGAVHLITDITERKVLEDQLRQAQKMEAIGLLAGGVAHDFNNGLTIITGYAELLIGNLPAGSGGQTHARQVLQAADRATSLTRQLLAFSRQQVVQMKVLDVNSIVGNVSGMLRRLIGEHIELRTVMRSLSGRMKADPNQIEQVILNLVVNARDAMPEGGRITIETSDVELGDLYTRTHFEAEPGPHVLIAVSDTGQGMDEESKGRIFEPFYTTKEVGKGTGLGLSTVYGIVKQHGGKIWVYSEPGHGTTFKVYFPACGEGGAAVEAAPPVREQEGNETILVVEDEPGLRGLVQDLLQRRGYQTLTASGLQEALDVCCYYQGHIDLLLTDVVMPNGSGRELALRVAPLRAGMRILYMSGYPDEAIVQHGVLEAGVPFLSKPFTEGALARKVREVMDSRPADIPAPALIQ